jgi:5-methylcytosine-specific restriction endonuclease McrA
MPEFRPVPKPGPHRRRPRARDLSLWRAAVLSRDGHQCRACGHRGPGDGSHLSAHHLIFKSHCEARYIDDPRNGLTLCNEFGNGCHQKVHDRRMQISRRWLPRVVIECLAEQGLAWDDTTGRPAGPLAVYFT